MDNPFGKKLGFGLMRLPLNNPDDMTNINLKTLQNMVGVFMERGFSYFDTAYVYGGSEEAIRETLVRRYPRDSFTYQQTPDICHLHRRRTGKRIPGTT